MPIVLALCYVLCHGLAVGLLPTQATALSFAFLVAAPSLAAAACLRRAPRGHSVLHWRATALALLLWAGGMAFNMVDALGADRANLTPQASLLLYVLYGVPLVFILARARRERPVISLIDALLAALLGVLFFVHTRSFAGAVDTDPAALAKLQLMFDIQNLCIAAFAVVRWIAADEPSRRGFFRALALYALLYLLVAGYINHCTNENAFGAYADVLIDLPFLLLALLALRDRQPTSTPRPRLARVVQAGGPMILPLLLLVVGTLVVDEARALALAGFVVATLGFGLRSTLLQIALLEGQAALDRLARQDGLTGVANRRQFDAVLQAEWNRARRSGRELALLLVDIDHFKAFNDRHGHPAGDRCLQAVAQALQAVAERGSDLVARYGGEEFAVVVPATPVGGVRVLAERLRAAVAGLALEEGTVTVSVGAACLHPSVLASPDGLLADADAALYAAKRAGRNRVVMHGPEAAIVLP